MTHLPKPPPATELTWAQAAGRACCFCGAAIWRGAVSVGRAPGRSGAHDLSVEVYACSSCARTDGPTPETETRGDS